MLLILEQLDGKQWLKIAFASQFLNTHEKKNSTKELELLRGVWATEHYNFYLNGAEFEMVTDHKALLSALTEKESNKTVQN